FAFYVAFPKSSIRPLGLPIYVARRPAAPFARCYPRSFTLITRTAPCLRQLPLAALPSTRAIPDRDVFYVAHPIRSIHRQKFVGESAPRTTQRTGELRERTRRYRSGSIPTRNRAPRRLRLHPSYFLIHTSLRACLSR